VEHVVCLEITHGLVGQLLLSAAAEVLLDHLLPVSCKLATMRFDRVPKPAVQSPVLLRDGIRDVRG
jgi:hypothetical protein